MSNSNEYRHATSPSYKRHLTQRQSPMSSGTATKATPSIEAKVVDQFLANYTFEQRRARLPQQQQQQQQTSQQLHQQHPQHHQQQQQHTQQGRMSPKIRATYNSGALMRQSSNRSLNSNRTSSDPAGDDYDMDDVSMPDSVTLRHQEQNMERERRSDYYHRTSTTSISENGVYNPRGGPYSISSNFTSSLVQPHRQEWRRRRSTGIQFAEDALLYSSDYAYEEVLKMWYDRDALAQFKQERKEIVKVLKKHSFHLPTIEKTYGDKYCLRGYEPYFSLEGNKEIRRQREATVSTVLNEQKRQRALAMNTLGNSGRQFKLASIMDHDLLAKHCADASKWARDCAGRLGTQDMNEVTKDYSRDIKARTQRQLWDRIIEKAIDEVFECHEQEFLQAAMEYSLLEQQQDRQYMPYDNYDDHHQQYHSDDDMRPQYHRSTSEELLRLQREQLLVLQEHQQQQKSRKPSDDNYNGSEVRPLSREEQIYQLQQDQLRVLQEERALQQQRDEMRRQQQQQEWYEEQEALQQRRLVLQHEQEQQRLREDERQQMLRLQQMESEQQRQKEQLRMMMEQQIRLEEQLRQGRQHGSGDEVDEDLASALRLVELQYDPSNAP